MNINDDLAEFTENDSKESDFREILFSYLRYWKWFLVSILIFSVLGYVYTKLQTPLYKIETDLLIKDNKQNKNGQNDLLKDLDLFTSDKIIDNEVQILKSKTIIEKVVKALNLQTSYFNTQGVRKPELYGSLPFDIRLVKPSGNAYSNTLSVQMINQKEIEVNGKKFPVGQPFETEEGLVLVTPKLTDERYFKLHISVKFKDLTDAAQQYSDKLKVDPVSKQATVLILTIEDAIPERGMDFLNKLVDEYDRAAAEDKNKVTSNTLAFIDERLDIIHQELGSDEKNVEHYKSSNQITDISAESQIFLQGVQDNDSQAGKVEIQLSVLKNLENYLDNFSDQSAKLPSMLGIEDPTLLGLVQQLGEVQLKRQSLLQTVPETNPLVTSYTDQITSLKQAISASIQNLKKGLQITQQNLLSRNNKFESTIKNIPTKERGLLDVMRQQDIKNSLYTYLLQKREETAIDLASGIADSRTIDEARSSKYPVKPVKSILYFMFFTFGLVLPAGVIYLKGLLNFRVTRKADIEKATRAAIIAEISYSADTSPLLVSTRPRSMVAEQIRALRTNLQFVIPGESQKVILFTSSMSGEGKSFVSLNLGASLAMSGKKSVILELDLRKPKLHSGLSIDNTSGLSNYLIGKAEYKDIVKQIPLQKDYYIITCGPIPPNPAELLLNGRIEVLIETLKKEFDYIILDAPPVGLVTDAQILGNYADATLFIIRCNYTAKIQINAIDSLYKSEKFKSLNIIMNSIDLDKGYGYGYGYGYGGYYEEEDATKKTFFSKLLGKDKTS